MGFLGLDKLFKKNSKQCKPKITNALVSAKTLMLIPTSWRDGWGGYDKYTSFKHLIELKEDVGKYKAGSIFKQEFRNECVFPSYDWNTGKFSFNETFRVNLKNWERV